MLLKLMRVYSYSKTKPSSNVLPEIIKYGSGEVMLQSSVRPEVKITTLSAIKVLKQVAFRQKVVSLSANQIGLSQRIFVVLKRELIKNGKWKDYQQEFTRHQIDNPELAYDAVVNPLQITSSYQQYYAYEQCPSFEGLKFKVKIPLFINLKYLSQQKLKKIVSQRASPKNYINIDQDSYTQEKIFGFRGRVWDHQIRHLEGILVIQQKICEGNFYLLDEYKEDIQNIQYYQQLKHNFKQFSQKNLQKMKKQWHAQIQNRKKGKNSNNSNNNLSKIQELIPDSIKQLKNKQIKKSLKKPSKDQKNFSKKTLKK